MTLYRPTLNLETWTLRRIPPEQLAVFHRLSDAWNCVVGAMGFAKWFASMTLKRTKDSAPRQEKKPRNRVPRKQRQQAKMEYLQSFLQANGFKSISSPLSVSMGPHTEVVYPIHAAAAYGCPHLVRMLLLMGADPKIRSSFGQTALDFAEESNQQNSHAEVLDLLHNEVKVLKFQSAMDLMMKQRQVKGDLVPVNSESDSEGTTVIISL